MLSALLQIIAELHHIPQRMIASNDDLFPIVRKSKGADVVRGEMCELLRRPVRQWLSPDVRNRPRVQGISQPLAVGHPMQVAANWRGHTRNFLPVVGIDHYQFTRLGAWQSRL